MNSFAARLDEPNCLDSENFTARVRGSYAMIRRSARRILNDDDEAQDVAQEVFLRALRKEALDGFVAPPAWLHRVTVNLCLNRLRDARRRRELMLGYQPEPRAGTPPEASAILLQVLRDVPAEFEHAVLGHYLDEESHAEIAAAMRVSRRTVGNRLAAFQAWLAARSG